MYCMAPPRSRVQFSIVQTAGLRGKSTQATFDTSVEATQTAASLLPVWDHLCCSQLNCIFAIVTFFSNGTIVPSGLSVCMEASSIQGQTPQVFFPDANVDEWIEASVYCVSPS